MRAWFIAKNTENVRYLADWLTVSYTDESGKAYQMCFDFQGENYYSKNKGLDGSWKGDLIPWVLTDLETGEELNLYEDDSLNDAFPDEKIVEILKLGYDYRIGVFPSPRRTSTAEEEDLRKMAKDEFAKGHGGICYNYNGNCFEKIFDFTVETEDQE